MSPHFPKEGARLSHATHHLSIGLSTRISICISNPHSGLSIVPAGLHLPIQASIKLLPRMIQHIAPPQGRKEPTAHPEGTFEPATWSHTRILTAQSKDGAWTGQSVVITSGVLQRASHLASERERSLWRDLFRRWDPGLQIT